MRLLLWARDGSIFVSYSSRLWLDADQVLTHADPTRLFTLVRFCLPKNYAYLVSSTEPEFLICYGAQELIPRNQFRQPL
jgi:hypothetical protein